MTEAVSLSLSHKAQQPERHCVRSERAASLVNYHNLCIKKGTVWPVCSGTLSFDVAVIEGKRHRYDSSFLYKITISNKKVQQSQ